MNVFIVINIILIIYIYTKIDWDSYVKPIYIDDDNVYIARENGRSGNLLLEYTILRLLAIQNGKAFSCRLKLPKPFDTVDRDVKSRKPIDLGLGFIKQLPLYSYHNTYYFGHRSFIQTELFPTVNITKQLYDVVVHIRLEDVFNHHIDYTILLPDFYLRVFSSITHLNSSSTVLVVSNPIDTFQYYLLEQHIKLFKKITNGANIIYIPNQSISNDWINLMSSPILVSSTSTFWMIPSFVSKVVKEIHVPFFGVTRSLLATPFKYNDNYNIIWYDKIPLIKNTRYVKNIYSNSQI